MSTSLIRHPLDLPADRLAEWVGACPEPAILESGPGFGEVGRWSIYTAKPRLVFEATDEDWSVRSGSLVTRSGRGDVLGQLGSLLARYRLADPTEVPDNDAPPFRGGMIGFFGYDFAPSLERLPRKASRDSLLPDVRFALYDTFITVDHASGAVQLGAVDLLEDGPEAFGKRVACWVKDVSGSASLGGPHATPTISEIGWNFTRQGYLDAVRACLEYIAAGDVFQVNLSQRSDWRGDVDPLALYLKLRAGSPAPFGCYLGSEAFAVVGVSPESFYETRGDRIVTRPIKGTRPRGRTPESDALLRDELATSPKDRAELTMIVDLERNDLGRVCRYGSVRVLSPLTVESFAEVHHLVATVEGRIRLGIGPTDVVRAMFPGGSVTGAPKIRAMEIIDELEPTRRGLYTGAVGYFSRGGTSAFNIVIRTMIVEADRLTLQLGGGIVADSDPEMEYQETLHKGQGFRKLLGDAWGRSVR